MWNFENKIVKTQWGLVPYSRFVASYNKICFRNHKPFFSEDFKEYLSLNKERFGIDDDDIRDIVEMADCGKLELEIFAEKYLKDRYEPVDVWG